MSDTMPKVVNLQSQMLQQKPKSFLEQYGEQASSRKIIGRLLKFSKGDWLLGVDNDEIPVGTRFVASMPHFLIGWTKWIDSKPAEEIMGPVVEGYTPPKRNELGDHDETLWETDDRGEPRDPWMFGNRLLFKPVGVPFTEDDAITFTTSSQGGVRAVGQFVHKVGKAQAMHTDENGNWVDHPIVEIGKDAYDHPNKAWGRIKIPVLTLVGWEHAGLFDVESAEVAPLAEDEKAQKNTRRRAAPAG